jgi:hypothetical protein
VEPELRHAATGELRADVGTQFGCDRGERNLPIDAGMPWHQGR